MIQAKNLTKHLGSRCGVNNISFTVPTRMARPTRRGAPHRHFDFEMLLFQGALITEPFGFTPLDGQ